jgi:hypothetical protein
MPGRALGTRLGTEVRVVSGEGSAWTVAETGGRERAVATGEGEDETFGRGRDPDPRYTATAIRLTAAAREAAQASVRDARTPVISVGLRSTPFSSLSDVRRSGRADGVF